MFMSKRCALPGAMLILDCCTTTQDNDDVHSRLLPESMSGSTTLLWHLCDICDSCCYWGLCRGLKSGSPPETMLVLEGQASTGAMHTCHPGSWYHLTCVAQYSCPCWPGHRWTGTECMTAGGLNPPPIICHVLLWMRKKAQLPLTLCHPW